MPSPLPPPWDAAARLFQLLLTTDGLPAFLQDVAALAADQLSPAKVVCALSVRTGDGTATVAGGDDVVRIEESQEESGSGPALEAARSRSLLAIPDLSAETRWPQFCEAALASGLLSAVFLPLVTAQDPEPIGVLSAYAGELEAFADTAPAHDIGAIAAGAIRVAMQLRAQGELIQQLQVALNSRAVIDQALGIVIAQRRCSAEDALEMLRAASQRTNVKLRDIAARIVVSTVGQ